ncbi:MAG TPA: M20 family metallopeptidase [Candidatus Dormibacteraeota bacterium]|nr:M20 family metallopeptidase [Candidatus Dormibacteraeota bacterium]
MSRPSVDSRDAIAFLQALVRLDTVNPPGHESLAADLIQARLVPLGFEIERLGAESGRDCLLATLRGTGGGPTLIFNGHTDVQPVGPGWTHDPFGAEIDGDRLYGNGVHDMKAGVAAFVLAGEALARQPRLRGTVVLQAVPDEVSGGVKGTGYLFAQKKLVGDYAVVCEPTGLDVFVAHRGMMWFTLSVHGEPAHSGRPWLGVNAIAKVSAVIQELTRTLGPVYAKRTHAMLPSPSINLGRIEGGAKENLVAARCRLTFDRRTVPGEEFDSVEAEIRDVIEGVRARDSEPWTFELTRTLAVPALEIDPASAIVRECRRAFRDVTGDESGIGCTSGLEDAHWLARAGIQTAMFGPYVAKRWQGENRFAAATGKPEEHVSLSQWFTAIEVYTQLARNLLT